MVPELRTPGSGLVVTASGVPAPWDVLFSGPTLAPELAMTPDDPGGTITFEGVTDNVLLADALALPDPSTGHTYVDGSESGYDVVHDDPESALHYYVSANIGPMYASTSDRSNPLLDMGTNLARGPVGRWTARYDMLGELCQTIATRGALNFRIVQRGDRLRFETNQRRDLRTTIRLDAANGTLAGQRVKTEAPNVTRVIVAGQGKANERQISSYWSAESVAAETAWGRRIERFLDQRQTDDADEHLEAASEVLAEGGYTGVVVQAVPEDDSSMRYGADWALGDLVTVVVDGQELIVYVVGLVLKVDADGCRLGAKLGTDYRTRTGDPLVAALKKVESRLSRSERVDDPSSGTPGEAYPPFRMAAGHATVTLSSTATATLGVNFPTDRFTQTPIVQVTNAGVGTSSEDMIVGLVDAGSSSGFTIRVRSRSGSAISGSCRVNWSAIQMTSASASG
jgi:hypothetical protein